MTETATGTDWQSWQQSWDRQQEWYMPDREERFRVMLDMVEARRRAPSRGCSTSRAVRAVSRTGSSSGSPAPPAPASTSTPRCSPSPAGTFDGDDRVTFVTADLKDPRLDRRGSRTRSYDAVLTATALHWLHSEPLAALYGQLAGVVGTAGSS